MQGARIGATVLLRSALTACLLASASGFWLGLQRLGRPSSTGAACTRCGHPSARAPRSTRRHGAAAALLSAAPDHPAGEGQGGEGGGGEGTRPGFTVAEVLRVPAPLPPLMPEHLDGEGSLRLPTALTVLFPASFPSITSAKKRVRCGEVLAEGVGGGGGLVELTTTTVVHGGETLLLQSRLQPGLYPQGRPPFELPVLYEDDHCAVVEKPPGVVTHKEKGAHARNTVKTGLAYALAPSKAEDPLWRPVPCHRLDGGTGGVLIAAKTRRAVRGLSEQFATRTVEKRYEAVVAGGVHPPQGEIDVPLGGKAARSEYRVLREVGSLKYGAVAHLALRPHTGRTHQLRRHCAQALGAPIVGDRAYGGGKWSPESCGLLLWATRVEFTHPVDGRRMSFESLPSPKFAAFISREEARYNKFNAPEQP